MWGNNVRYNPVGNCKLDARFGLGAERMNKSNINVIVTVK